MALFGAETWKGKSRIVSALLTSVLAASSVVFVAAPASAASCTSTTAPTGTGVSGDPYLISSAAELIYVSLNQGTGNFLAAEYQQTANLNLGECDFTPIGSESSPFSGVYDGNSKTISGLVIPSASATGGVGLFGAVSGDITKLGIDGGVISGTSSRAGLLAGVLAVGATVSESYATGSINGNERLGGLVGHSDGATITDSWTNVAMNGTDRVGGFVGSFGSTSSSLARNYAIGDVTASGANKGGFAGEAYASSNNFFKTSTAGPTSTSQGVGMNLENFRVRANFTNFDFTSAWRIEGSANGGLPYLAWQSIVPLVATNVGTDFYTTFGDNSSDPSRRLELYLSSEVDTSATITFPSGATESVNLQAGVTRTVNVTTQIGNMYNQVLEGVTNNGVRVQSADPISVYGIHFINSSTDAWAALPTSSLGYDYTVNLPASRPSTQGASSNLQIFAAEPGTTTVTINPKADMHKLGGFPYLVNSSSVVTLDKATNSITLAMGSANARFDVGETFYLQRDLKVRDGDAGFVAAANAFTSGVGSSPRVFTVTAATSSNLTFVTDVDLSGVTDTDLRLDGEQNLMRLREQSDWDIANNSVVTLDPGTNTVTIANATISSALKVGDVFYFGANLSVDNSTDGLTLAATALSGVAPIVPNKFTVSAVDPGVSFSFVTNADLSALVDTSVLVNSSSLGIWPLNQAGTPFTVSLQQGQVYNLQVDRGTDETRTRDISGTTVSSDRKVGVIVSSFLNTTPEGTSGAYDQIFEQLVPTNRWGSEYLVPHGPTSAGASTRDTLKIVARDNATAVSVNGTLLATLNAGETVQAAVTRAAPGVDIVSADKPISVMHVTTGQGSYTDGVLAQVSGDPAIAVVPPVTQYLNSYVVTTPATDFTVNAAMIIVKKTEKGLITRAGFAIGADKFTDIPNTDYAVGRIFIPLGTHYFRAPSGFMLIVSGYDTTDSYSYPGGFGLVDPVAYPNGVPELSALQTATKPVSVGGDFISGTPTLCGTLTANEGSWLDGRSAITSTSYQWLRNGQPISGATATTLALADFASGDLISFEIQKTNAVGTTTAFSTPVTITDALLTSLETSVGTLSPSFGACTTSYTVNVVQDSLRITAGANSGTAIAITESNAGLLAGQSSAAQTLTLGANTRTLTATRNGVSTSYTLNINYTSGPIISMLAPSAIEETTATIRASANANGNQLSAASFEYSTASDFTGSTTTNATFTTSTGIQTLSLNLASLTAGQTYYVRASVTNSVGTVVSQSFQFTTKAAPRISSVTPVARDSTIENEIDFTVNIVPNGSSTQLAVRWSLSPDLSNPTDVNLGSPQTSTTALSTPLSGLPAGSLIYYELSVTNQFGTNYWPVSSFQLIGVPIISEPLITTTATTAIVEFPVNPRGGKTDLICASYSLNTINTPGCLAQNEGTPMILDGNENQTSRFEFTGLNPNTTYYVKALARNYFTPPTSGRQIGYSSNYTFTTQSAATLTSSVAGPASVGPNDSIQLLFRFSEAITGFDKTDVTLSGATTGWTTQPTYQVGPGLYIMEIRPTGTVTAPSTLTIDAVTPGTSSSGGAFPATNSLNISVLAAKTIQFAYANATLSLTENEVMTPNSVVPLAGSVAPLTFSISPALPTGLTLNTSTGAISGTPAVGSEQVATTYTITGVDGLLSESATVSIVIARQIVVNPPPHQQQQNNPQLGNSDYSGPIITALSKTRARPGDSMAAFGSRLAGISHIEIAGIRIDVSELEDERFVFSLPENISAGTHDIIAFSSTGRLITQDALVIESAAIDRRKLNAGTFNNVVAIYAKGYDGQRLTAKVGEDWVIVNRLRGDYVRIIERTRWIGHPIKVRIFIDRKLMATIDLVTE